MIDFFTFLARPVIALVIVIFLFWLWNKHGQKIETWVKKRFPARGDTSTHRSVTVRESRRLNRKATLMVIDFEGERLLLGVSDGVLTMLHSVSVGAIEHESAAPEPAPKPATPPKTAAAPKSAEKLAFGDALKTATVNSLSQFSFNRSKLK